MCRSVCKGLTVSPLVLSWERLGGYIRQYNLSNETRLKFLGSKKVHFSAVWNPKLKYWQKWLWKKTNLKFWKVVLISKVRKMVTFRCDFRLENNKLHIYKIFHHVNKGEKLFVFYPGLWTFLFTSASDIISLKSEVNYLLFEIKIVYVPGLESNAIN